MAPARRCNETHFPIEIDCNGSTCYVTAKRRVPATRAAARTRWHCRILAASADPGWGAPGLGGDWEIM